MHGRKCIVLVLVGRREAAYTKFDGAKVEVVGEISRYPIWNSTSMVPCNLTDRDHCRI